jgi:hypothetical protein
MADTVTVTRKGKSTSSGRYLVTFSRLPGQTFGPWDMPETVQDLRVSALLDPREARDLVLDAAVNGSATTETR